MGGIHREGREAGGGGGGLQKGPATLAASRKALYASLYIISHHATVGEYWREQRGDRVGRGRRGQTRVLPATRVDPPGLFLRGLHVAQHRTKPRKYNEIRD